MKTKELPLQLKDSIVKLLSTDEKNLEIGIYENSSGVQYTLEEFFSQYNPEEIGKGQCNLVFKVDLNKKNIATFQLKDMYNCCGIIVGSDLFIHKAFRNKGLGNLMTDFMAKFSKYYGYGIIQGSDKSDNDHQMRIFEKLKWQRTSEFYNPKTGNKLTIFLLNLNEN
jgi:GNAT superfamily N-acetyltransferase